MFEKITWRNLTRELPKAIAAIRDKPTHEEQYILLCQLRDVIVRAQEDLQEVKGKFFEKFLGLREQPVRFESFSQKIRFFDNTLNSVDELRQKIDGMLSNQHRQAEGTHTTVVDRFSLLEIDQYSFADLERMIGEVENQNNAVLDIEQERIQCIKRFLEEEAERFEQQSKVDPYTGARRLAPTCFSSLL